jgi:ABC-2 type transport system permease protein
MKPYAAILSARTRMMLQYRGAALGGIGCQLFWGYIRLMIFDAFYRSTTTAPPLDWAQMVSYIWLGQALFALFPWNVDREVQAMIRTGTVAYEMLRPVDLYGLWYSRAVAARLAPTLLRAVPQFLIAGLFFGLRPPASLASGVAWVLATTGALLLAAAFTTLFTISLLWTISGEGLWRLIQAVAPLLSGLLIPLPFFPQWAQPLLNALPFRGLIDVPFRVYVGNIPPEQIGAVLAHQAAWIAALVFLGRRLLAHGTHRLVVQGG